jgi:hypothetical protein
MIVIILQFLLDFEQQQSIFYTMSKVQFIYFHNIMQIMWPTTSKHTSFLIHQIYLHHIFLAYKFDGIWAIFLYKKKKKKTFTSIYCVVKKKLFDWC